MIKELLSRYCFRNINNERENNMNITVLNPNIHTTPANSSNFMTGDLVLGKFWDNSDEKTLCVVGYGTAISSSGSKYDAQFFVVLATGKICEPERVMHDWQVCNNTEVIVNL